LRIDRFILLGLMSVLPVAFWTGSTSYEAAKLFVLAIAVGAFLCSASLKIWQKQKLSLPSKTQIIAPLVGVLLILISGFASGHPSLSLRTAAFAMAWIIVWWTVLLGIRAEREAVPLLRAMVAGGCVASLYGIAQIVGLLPGPDPSLGVPSGISTFGNENQMAGLSAILVWPTLALLLLARSKMAFTWSCLALVVLLTAVFVADASGPQVAFVIALVITASGWMLVKAKARWSRGRLFLIVLATGAAGIVLLFARLLDLQLLAGFPMPEFAAQMLDENSGDVRRTDWLVAWRMYLDNKFLGVGAGNYQVHWPHARAVLTNLTLHTDLAVHTPLATRAHNEYLQLMAEWGLSGVVYLGALLVLFTREFKRRWTDHNTAPLTGVWFVLLGSVITVAVHSLVSFPMHLPAPAFLMAGIMGLMGGTAFRGRASLAKALPISRNVFWVPAVAGIVIIGLGVRDFVGDSITARGERNYAAGQFSKSESELSHGLKLMIWPEHGDLYLGLSQIASQRPAEAAANLKASLLHHPTFEALLALAEINIDRQQYREATAQLELVKDCQPTEQFRRQSRYLNGMITLRQGQYNAAQTAFVELLKDAPRDYRTLLALGYLAVLENDINKARAMYERALALIEADLQNTADQGERVRLLEVRRVAKRAIESVR
jgi:O-antigen ligase/predicted negative regulator of RcsB-dependent stress response